MRRRRLRRLQLRQCVGLQLVCTIPVLLLCLALALAVVPRIPELTAPCAVAAAVGMVLAALALWRTNSEGMIWYWVSVTLCIPTGGAAGAALGGDVGRN